MILSETGDNILYVISRIYAEARGVFCGWRKKRVCLRRDRRSADNMLKR